MRTISNFGDSIWLIAVMLAVCCPDPSSAQEASHDDLEHQISDLDSGSYDERETAASKLVAAGVLAVPLLESTVDRAKLEARVRSLRLLQEIYQANDFAASFAAGDALRRLALHQQEMIASFASDALAAQRGLAIGRLKAKGAKFQTDDSIVEIGELWKGEPDDLIDLRWCNSLKTLRLSQPELDDRSLAPLEWLSQVTELVIFDAPITDNGLIHLRHLPKLKVLHLARTQVTDAGLVHLSSLTSLTFLDLSRSQIVGNGLNRLYSLDQLRHLDLRGLQIPEASLHQLRKHLPRLHVLKDN